MKHGWSGLNNLFDLSEEQITLITKKSIGTALQPQPKQLRPIRFMRRWSVAAAAILLLGAGIYLWVSNTRNSSVEAISVAADTHDIPPGREGAVLQLADGTRIVLDSLREGVIATQNGTEVLL